MLDTDERAAVGATLADLPPERRSELGQLGGDSPANESLGGGGTSTDGLVEVPRILSASETLPFEVTIEWEEALGPLDYVREAYVAKSTWREPVPAPRTAERRVGYAVHAPPGDNKTPAETVLERRVFYLKSHDRTVAPNDVYTTGAPGEAVDPRTVFPSVAGVMTDRARGQAGSGSAKTGDPA